MADWTTAADLRSVLERRWRSPALLRSYAERTSLAPFSLPVRRPTADDLLERRADVEAWLRSLTGACAPTSRRPGLRIEWTAVPGRRIGRNELPRRVWVDSYALLFGWLGVQSEVATLDALLAQTQDLVPELAEWSVRHPPLLVENAAEWPRLLATVAWILRHDQYLYLRQVDVPAVDTKFIERHKILLGRLLDAVLPERRVDLRYNVSDFASRYRFRRRPDYTRLRTLGTPELLPGGLTELTARTDELSRLTITANRVIIVENDVSYLALPDQPDTIAIFGSGFAVGSVTALRWLGERQIVYWGDLDTHGFAILNQLRTRYGEVTSILMDTATLLAHREQWVTEERPTDRLLPHLTDAEGAVYRDLVEDRYGRRLRLEQERISFARVLVALDDAS